MVGCDAVEFDVHEYMRYVRCIWSFISIPMQIFEVGIEELQMYQTVLLNRRMS